MKAPRPSNERRRLEELHRLAVLDTPPEKSLEDLVHLAIEVCDVPIAGISLVDRDRMWLKSSVGLADRETPRDASICAHTILHAQGPLIVEDATRDGRFADCPLVTGAPGIRFYAGVPLVTRHGNALGALFVIDRVARRPEEGQVRALIALGRLAVALLEARHAVSTQSPLEHLCELLEGMRLGVFVATGALGRISAGNQAMVDLVEAEDLSALKLVRLRDLFETPLEYERLLDQALRGRPVVMQPVSLKTVQGHPLAAAITATAERRDHCLHVEGILQDVSAATQAQHERDRFFNLALDMLCVAASDGCLQLVNPAFERTLGYSQAELQGKPYVDLVHPEDVPATIRELLRLASGERALHFTNRCRCQSGDYRYLEWVTAAHPEEGKVYAVARDVTERLRAEDNARALLATRVELDLAREIQRKLLPASAPRIPTFDIAGFVKQVDSTGGDYYDYIPCGDHVLYLAVGDVAGHGVAPSVVMAQLRTCLWSIIPHCTNPAEVLERVNVLLHASIPDRYFVTMQLIELDTRSGRIRHANCGHPSGFVVTHAGEIATRLESSGLPMGCFPECGVRCEEGARLAPGDTLVCVTDGILEASAPSGELFGEDRVLDLVRLNHHRSAEEIIQRLQRELHEFCGPGVSACDDTTAIVVRRTELAESPTPPPPPA